MQTINYKLNDHSYFTGLMQSAPAETPEKRYPTIVIVPGGSYTHIPEQQTEKVALAFAAQGFNAVYLRYSFVNEVTPLLPTPVIELAQTVHQLKTTSQWPVDQNALFIFGMSVGGHIAALYNDFWHTDWLIEVTDSTGDLLKPTGVLLGYPVISPLLGFPTNEEALSKWTDDPTKFAADQHVNTLNQPTFAWVTADDPLVPAQNTLSYVSALMKSNISVETHFFDHGPHGLALANHTTATRPASDNPHVAHWFELALEWIEHLTQNRNKD